LFEAVAVGDKYGLIAVSVLTGKMCEGRCRGSALSFVNGHPSERFRCSPACVLQIPQSRDKSGPSDTPRDYGPHPFGYEPRVVLPSLYELIAELHQQRIGFKPIGRIRNAGHGMIAAPRPIGRLLNPLRVDWVEYDPDSGCSLPFSVPTCL
jgi:hypothetical protein